MVMSQIATRNDVNSKCTGSMLSGVECPTKKEINNTALVGVKGDYVDNECVKIEDLVVGVKGKIFTVSLTTSGSLSVDRLVIRSSSDNNRVEWNPKTGDIVEATVQFTGDSKNSDTLCVDIGKFGANRHVIWYDNQHPNGVDLGWFKETTWYSGWNWNEWLNNNWSCHITVN